MKKHSIAIKIFMLFVATVCSFALIVQLVLMLNNVPERSPTYTNAIVSYFSFFTILSNVLVAKSLGWSLLFPSTKIGMFCARPTVRSAVAVYIFIVGVIYNIVLKSIWNPQGWQLVADRILHDVVPVTYVICWYFMVPAKSLQWNSFLWWLIFPLCYLIYSLVRGMFTGWFPYPFLDVTKEGWNKVLLNSFAIAVSFCVVSILFTGVNKYFKSKTAA